MLHHTHSLEERKVPTQGTIEATRISLVASDEPKSLYADLQERALRRARMRARDLGRGILGPDSAREQPRSRRPRRKTRRWVS